MSNYSKKREMSEFYEFIPFRNAPNPLRAVTIGTLAMGRTVFPSKSNISLERDLARLHSSKSPRVDLWVNMSGR